MKLLKLLGALTALFLMSGSVQAHLVSFGWTDNGNGTVTLWGEHWHGAQTSPSTANGGIHITDVSGSLPSFTAQWTGVQNNTTLASMMSDGTLTGFSANTGFAGSGTEHNWLYSSPIVIGDGDWSFFTGTTCCIDTMAAPVIVTLAGITSVPPGTVPGTPPSGVPEAGSLGLLGLGLIGMFVARRRNKTA